MKMVCANESLTVHKGWDLEFDLCRGKSAKIVLRVPMLLVAQGSPCPWCPFGPTGLQVPLGFAPRSGGFQPQIFRSCFHVQQ